MNFTPFLKSPGTSRLFPAFTGRVKGWKIRGFKSTRQTELRTLKSGFFFFKAERKLKARLAGWRAERGMGARRARQARATLDTGTNNGKPRAGGRGRKGSAAGGSLCSRQGAPGLMGIISLRSLCCCQFGAPSTQKEHFRSPIAAACSQPRSSPGEEERASKMGKEEEGASKMGKEEGGASKMSKEQLLSALLALWASTLSRKQGSYSRNYHKIHGLGWKGL